MKKSVIILSLLFFGFSDVQSKPRNLVFRSNNFKVESKASTPFSKKRSGIRFFGNPFVSGSKISNIAKKDLGTYFRRGTSHQCANYVAHVVERAGGSPPPSKSMARAWLKWGRPVSVRSMRAGDIIVTSRGSNSYSGHILIYKGGGVAIHRSTYSRPIREIQVSVYSSRILGVRRAS